MLPLVGSNNTLVPVPPITWVQVAAPSLDLKMPIRLEASRIWLFDGLMASAPIVVRTKGPMIFVQLAPPLVDFKIPAP